MPTIIIVQGAPGVGKTTLAHRLSADIGIGFIAKDDIKELLYETYGHPVDRAASQIMGRAVIKALYVLASELSEGVSDFIVESAFQPEFANSEMRALAKKTTLIQVYCYAAVEVIMERFNTRITDGSRHHGHGDQPITDLEQLRQRVASYGPLDVAHTITVDLGNVDNDTYATLVAQLKAGLSNAQQSVVL